MKNSPLNKHRTGSPLYKIKPYSKPKHRVIQIGVKKRSVNPNSPDVMQKTLDGVRKGGYKGANWIR